MPHAEHWQSIYSTRALDSVGWYERHPSTSPRLVAEAVDRGAESVIDIGGEASSLVDHLLDLGLARVAVLDIAEASLAASQARLGDRADLVEWIVGDVTKARVIGRFDVWHDRAVFHFLTDDSDRRRCAALAARTITPGGRRSWRRSRPTDRNAADRLPQ